MTASRIVLAALLGALLLPAASGCGTSGSGTSAGAATAQHHDLEEISRLFRMFRKSQKPPPKSEADFLRYQAGFPLGVGAIKKKDIVVCWNAGLSDGSDAASAVLAYEKSVPQSGGGVLMQDGTVREMTAEEFKAAPKAR